MGVVVPRQALGVGGRREEEPEGVPDDVFQGVAASKSRLKQWAGWFEEGSQASLAVTTFPIVGMTVRLKLT